MNARDSTCACALLRNGRSPSVHSCDVSQLSARTSRAHPHHSSSRTLYSWSLRFYSSCLYSWSCSCWHSFSAIREPWLVASTAAADVAPFSGAPARKGSRAELSTSSSCARHNSGSARTAAPARQSARRRLRLIERRQAEMRITSGEEEAD